MTWRLLSSVRGVLLATLALMGLLLLSACGNTGLVQTSGSADAGRTTLGPSDASQATAPTCTTDCDCIATQHCEDVGGEISVNFRRLYNYLNVRLREANRNKKKEPLQEALMRLRVLRDSWAEMLQRGPDAPVGRGAGSDAESFLQTAAA